MFSLILAAAAQAAAPAPATAVGTASDATCLAIFTAMASQEKPPEGVGFAVTYFLGRIEGSNPRGDLFSLMKTEFGKLTPANGDAYAKQCSGRFEAGGKRMTDVVARLQASQAATPPAKK